MRLQIGLFKRKLFKLSFLNSCDEVTRQDKKKWIVGISSISRDKFFLPS